jgi:hemolysin activation/secretion protein
MLQVIKKQFFFFGWMFFCATGMYAQSESCITTPNKEPPAHSHKDIRAIILVPNREAMLSEADVAGLNPLGVVSFNVRVPGSTAPLTEILDPIAFNKPLSKKIAREIEQAISKYFYENGDPFVLVTIPSRNQHEGIVQVVVHHATVDRIKFEGQTWSSTEKLQHNVKIKPESELSLPSLDRSLYEMNRNPFRRVDLIYSPGEKPGTTDLTFFVNEKRPYRIYAGFSNPGVATTERQRWFTGFTVGNLFYADQVFSFQYMSTYNIDRFQAYTGQYLIPLPKGQMLNFYGGYSTVTADLPFPSMKTHGYSSQVSMRYLIPSSFTQGAPREWFVGGDFKATNNTLEFSEVFPNIAKLVNLTQLVFGVIQKIEKPTYRLDMDAEFIWSPGQWIANQSNADYEALRPDAKNHWVIGRASLKYTQNIPKDCKLFFYLRGQWASQNLLPSEQVGLGGYETVRGYTERQLNYDSGLLATAEFRSPSWPFVSAVQGRRIQDDFHIILFMDYGVGTNHNLLPGEPNSDYLWGVGPGLRYNLYPYVIAKLDWGIKLHQQELFIGGGSMLYYSVTVSY